MANQRVNPIPATPPRYSLLQVAPEVPAVDPPERWQDGWVFNPEGCGTSGRVALNCRGGTGEMTDGAENPGDVTGTPFVVWAWDQCSMLGFQARDFEGRARRQLLATESYQVANELWTGSLRDSIAPTAKQLENAALVDADADVVTDGAVSPGAALAEVVGALSSCGMGTRGMVHVTPKMLVALAAADVIYQSGGVWVTPMEHIVVADAGYPGTGPDGATGEWIYGTSMIYTRRSDVLVPATFEQSVDRSVNTVTLYAQRLAGFMWDGCCHVAAEVNPTAGFGGGVDGGTP